jgi:hypothetical protein
VIACRCRCLSSARSRGYASPRTGSRRKATIDRWVRALADLLADHGEDDALRNRVHHLLMRRAGWTAQTVSIPHGY